MSDVTRYVIVGDGAIAPEWPEADPVRNRFVLAADYDAMTSKRDALAQAVDRIAKERDALQRRVEELTVTEDAEIVGRRNEVKVLAAQLAACREAQP